MPCNLRPFWCYYGGKWRGAKRYPEPQHETIVEPFAGAAGYATRYHERNVVLVEKDPIIAELWRYLIGASPDEIEALPLIDMDETLDDHPELSSGARSLIGFWLNKGTTRPCKRPSAWMRSGIRPKSYWGAEIREILAGQVDEISHWTIIEDDYALMWPNSATWFIDPPYQRSGKHYAFRDIDYAALARWCRTRPGQVIVCEQEGADWLPFESLATVKSTPGKRGKSYSKEVMWCNTLKGLLG